MRISAVIVKYVISRSRGSDPCNEISDCQESPVGLIRILGIGLGLACNRGYWGESFRVQMTFSLFNDILPHEPPLQASFSPIPRIRIWSIAQLVKRIFFKSIETQKEKRNWSGLRKITNDKPGKV